MTSLSRTLIAAFVCAAGATISGAQARSTDSISPAELSRMYSLGKRWAQLTANVLAEFRADGRDPTAKVLGDFSTRTLRLLTDVEDDESGVEITLTEEQLAGADLTRLAKDLYQVWLKS